MLHRWLFASVVALCAACATAEPPATSRVEVSFAEPEKLADAGQPYRESANLTEIRRFVQRRAQPLLGEGKTLAIDITQLDLAGGYEPWRARGYDLRIVRGVYPPRIDLRFRLTGPQGELVKEGARELRDLAFQLAGTRYRDDPLRYEKALLEDWLEREFGPA